MGLHRDSGGEVKKMELGWRSSAEKRGGVERTGDEGTEVGEGEGETETVIGLSGRRGIGTWRRNTLE